MREEDERHSLAGGVMDTTEIEDDFGGVLGLEHQVVRFHEPTPLWAEFYQQEESRLRGALAGLGDVLVDIQHFGSTSIPNIQAKPILDILVGIRRLEDGPRCIGPLEAIGYEYAPWAGIPGDLTFGKGERRTHLVHVVEYGGANWSENIRFRDALRRDPELAREYEALKLRLGQEHSESRADYTEAKTEFIRRINTAAM